MKRLHSRALQDCYAHAAGEKKKRGLHDVSVVFNKLVAMQTCAHHMWTRSDGPVGGTQGGARETYSTVGNMILGNCKHNSVA